MLTGTAFIPDKTHCHRPIDLAYELEDRKELDFHSRSAISCQYVQN